jgi:hypothetical protein
MMVEDFIFQKLCGRKVFTVPYLMTTLSCSLRTVRRRLKSWKTYSSINKNGKYYTLPDVPTFGANGLWNYRSILFSQHGNLKQTLLHFIDQSPMGLMAYELMEQVALPSNSSFLSHLQSASEVRREKHGGHSIYFSPVTKIYTQQKRERIRFALQARTQFPDEEAVMVLVEFIKHPHLGPEELAYRISRQGRSIAPEAIRWFFESHGLLKKKLRI